jgi:hypothetical protein
VAALRGMGWESGLATFMMAARQNISRGGDWDCDFHIGDMTREGIPKSEPHLRILVVRVEMSKGREGFAESVAVLGDAMGLGLQRREFALRGTP